MTTVTAATATAVTATTATAAQAIQAAYPAQYYGVIASGKISALLDVWAAETINGTGFDLLSLPAASSLVALTAEQWALAKVSSISGMLNVFVSGSSIEYPARFYCTKTTPCAVYDLWGFGDLDNAPAVADLYAITASEYADRLANPRAQYYDTSTGKLDNYVAPVVPVPLKTQAATLLAQQQTYVMQTYTLYGDVTPPDWLSYLKTLRAIANGTDSTSTTLPTAPAS
ncbi:hypothetical protein HK15_08875 [Acetobacter orientalis]|uniref:Uncharacterized protein n=1 Tax=Acetobacter orientalis TaxID=146474 RepID=A0A252BH85_9PROT|nr:hypothetical protein [Acetobacter orientalis]OUJ03869.1 hypothetical protein HK15_08875 [Acetobacter orientalis]